MLDKFEIKRFVSDTIHSFRGLARRLAGCFGKSEFWMSDLLDPRSETDGHVFAYILFMSRLHDVEPEAHAIIDDYVRKLMDELRAKGVKGNTNQTIDTIVEQICGTHGRFLTIYRNRAGRGELKAV